MTTSAHQRYDDLAAAYALGALDAEERADMEAHLTTCDDCTRVVAGLRATVGTLPMAAPRVEPPAGLRERVLAAVATEARPARGASPARGFVLARYALAASVAALALAGAALIGWAIGSPEAAEDDAGRLLARSYDALSIMARADQRWDVEATSAAPGAWGIVAYDSDAGEASLIMWGLEDAPGAEYRVWVADGGSRQRVGRLYAADGGFWAVVPHDVTSADALGVTLVKDGGGPVDVLDARLGPQ